jgi:multidrug efflux pump subunit AcrA (membrane-fusion protein)
MVSDKKTQSWSSERLVPVSKNATWKNKTNTVLITEINGEFVTLNYNNKISKSPLSVENISDLTENSLPKSLTQLQEEEKIPVKSSEGPGFLLGLGVGVLLAIIGNRSLVPQQTQNQIKAANPTAPLVTTKTNSTTAVTIATIESSTIENTLKVNGTIAAFNTIPVMSQAMGLQIEELMADRGQFVQQGQILARLEDSVLQSQLQEAQAAVLQAEANLAQLKAGARQEEIAKAKENISKAREGILQAESTLGLIEKRVKRTAYLQKEGAITFDRLDEIVTQEKNAQSNLQQSQATWRAAQQELAQLQAGARKEEILQAEAILSQARAKVKTILAKLKDTLVVAPTSGKIAERLVNIGDLTSPANKLFTIIENGRLELRLKVPQDRLSSIRVGQKVQIFSAVDKKLTMTGMVREIDPTIDSQYRQATVKVNLPADTSLKPGMFLKAEITTSTQETISIPMSALLPQGNNQALVYILQSDNSVKATTVETSEVLSTNRVIITKGLQIGDRLVIKGVAYLQNGDRPKIVN